MMDGSAAFDAGRSLRVLLLEDSNLDAELVTEALGSLGLAHSVERVIDRDDFARALREGSHDLILADYVLPSFDGMSALKLAREIRPDTPFVFVSGTLGEEIAVEALKRGATDYVLKQRLERLPATVLRARAEALERAERQRAQDAVRALLDEKTTLVHELDHRVKNNLQLLLSLVSHEIRRSESEEVRRSLARFKQRLQALGTVHRKLHNGDEVGTFDAAEFARDLSEDLLAHSGRGDVRAEFTVQPIPVPADKAAPVALLLNEIVSNALTHAYEGRHGFLRLAVRRLDGAWQFEMSDERFSPEEREAAQAGSSGLILQALARQLDATVAWPEDEPSVLVRVTMPVGGPGG
jgi:two-component sensor histidine kinase